MWYTNIDNSHGFWQFPTNAYSINGIRTARSSSAIADTGTSLTIMEDSVVKDIYSKIPGSYYDENAGVSFSLTTQCSAMSVAVSMTCD